MLVFLVVWVLLCAASLARASVTEIPITFYTDNSCVVASTTAANVSLTLDVCTVTPGLGSFVLNPFPCSSGNVVNYAFTDTACGNPDRDYYKLGGHCSGRIRGAMAAIILSCDQDSPRPPTSTTTINVGPIAGDASPTSASTIAKSGSEEDSSSPTPTTTTISSSSPSSSSSSTPSGGWNSLDYGARIGIIVALSVGIPPIIIGILTLYAKKKKNKTKSSMIHHETHPFHNIRSAPPSSGYP